MDFLDTAKVYRDVNDLKTFHQTLRLQIFRYYIRSIWYCSI